MSRSPKFRSRTAAILLAAGLVLSGCGDETAADEAAGGLDSLTISGEVGKAPKVTFDGEVNPEETESEVVSEGDGEELAAGDSVFAHIWIGNGFTQKETYNTYALKSPQLLSGELSSPFQEAVDGHTVGSRVAVASSAEDAFGEGGNPSVGIGNKDGVVFIIDLLGKVAAEPSGETKQQAKWSPTLIEKDGVVTGFDFAGAKKPPITQDTYLVKGDGPVVEKGQTIAVRYLGQVFGGKKPFDENFTGDVTSFAIGVGQVVKGWDQELVGKPVGSRLIISIPPEDGYGEGGNAQAGIKGTDTLVFVVDILGAA